MTTGDYSNTYALSKRAMIYIASREVVVSFKPFLDELSYQKEQKTKQIKKFFDTIEMTEAAKESRKLSFKVVASDKQEARQNHIKFQKLLRMIYPDKKSNRSTFYVKFSNLITNHEEPDAQRLYGYQKMQTSGLQCQCTGIDYKPEVDTGFFDEDGMLFAKTYTISLDMKVIHIPNRKIPKTQFDKADNKKKPGASFGFRTPFIKKKQDKK